MSGPGLDISVLQHERGRVEDAMALLPCFGEEEAKAWDRHQAKLDRLNKRIDELVEELLAS